jgi:hypothetical protein
VLANSATNTFSSTKHTRIRSAGAERKKVTKFETQDLEKHGERNGGVIHRGHGELGGGRKDGDGDTSEWNDDRMWDWNAVPGEKRD